MNYLKDIILMSVLVVLVVNGTPIPSVHSEVLTSEWTSGEELAINSFSTKPRPSTKWEQIIKMLVHEVTTFRDQQFVEEFQMPLENMSSFAEHQVPSIPQHLTKTPCFSNYSKEACLQEISRGLQVYQVLLQHVQTEYPQSNVIPMVRDHANVLIGLVIGKMKAVVVESLPASEKEQVLGEVSTATEWHKKTSVHAILRDLRHFLVDTKRALCRMGKKGEGCQ
ncbi:interleukin-6-like [Esox lucius]|uniref:Interleukin-6 n=1 Tax=Esox lucius TaxID=8010 RepID=A0A3P8ZEE2_ESOLU|nr:interleukin-6-like [Esox lucius]